MKINLILRAKASCFVLSALLCISSITKIKDFLSHLSRSCRRYSHFAVHKFDYENQRFSPQGAFGVSHLSGLPCGIPRAHTVLVVKCPGICACKHAQILGRLTTLSRVFYQHIAACATLSCIFCPGTGFLKFDLSRDSCFCFFFGTLRSKRVSYIVGMISHSFKIDQDIRKYA